LFGGDRGTCGTTSVGGFECFGQLEGGQLNSPTNYSDPELHDLVTVAAADNATCALRTDGSRVCWGNDNNGQLGDGMNIANSTPTVYDGGITSVALHSEHGCEVTNAGTVMCWGTNGSLESGVGTGNPILTPTLVQQSNGTLGGCTRVAVGPDYSCALCKDNVWCWGRSNHNQTGNRTITQRHIADVVGLPAGTFVELAAGDYRACALDNAGNLFCWGDGPHGETGDGSHASPFPVPVAPP
jgi:alpha-tubulin suppressor-like RCC1 family protein